MYFLRVAVSFAFPQPQRLSAVSGAPRDGVMRNWSALNVGCFGYSGLKEAALMEAMYFEWL